MKVSLKWLREYVEITQPPEELAHRLTMAGIEVSDVHTVGSEWRDICVARIEEVAPHPNADRLQLAILDLGQGKATVVTGAPNIHKGDHVPYARPGAQLCDAQTGEPTTVRSAVLRGVEAGGVLCSGRELGAGEAPPGILVLPPDPPVGVPLTEVLGDV